LKMVFGCCCWDEPATKPQFILFISAAQKAGATSLLRRVLKDRQPRSAVSSSLPPALSGYSLSGADLRPGTVPTVRDFDLFTAAADPAASSSRGGAQLTLVDIGRPLRAELIDSSLRKSPQPLQKGGGSTSQCSGAQLSLQALLEKATGIVFVVDCSACETLQGQLVLSGAQQLLFSSLRRVVNEQLPQGRRGVLSLYVAANKQDVASSVSVRQTVDSLGLRTAGGGWPSVSAWTCQPSASTIPSLKPQTGILEFFSLVAATPRPTSSQAKQQQHLHASAAPSESMHGKLPAVGSDAELTQRLSSPRCSGCDGLQMPDDVGPQAKASGGPNSAGPLLHRGKYAPLEA
jgi:hypothetical protein